MIVFKDFNHVYYGHATFYHYYKRKTSRYDGPSRTFFGEEYKRRKNNYLLPNHVFFVDLSFFKEDLELQFNQKYFKLGYNDII